VLSDTISAIATPIGGEGGIGVVRISGPSSLNIIKTIFRPSLEGDFSSYKLRHGWVVDNLYSLDEALVSYMAAPKSYTGEDVIEISCHGGPAVLKQVLALTIKVGARLAERGEFTKRAFLNGRLDLAQAEAVINLVKAKTREGSLLAASQLKGSLSSKINSTRDGLLKLLAEIEASVDFPDEVDDIKAAELISVLNKSIVDINGLLDTADAGIIYRDGISIAIIGKPNVGKSSLLNALLREDRAIVTDEPGTTRDTIEETLNIKGIPARVIDTAGIRHSTSMIEKIGVDRALTALNKADLVLLVVDISQKLSAEDTRLFDASRNSKVIIALNKSDRPHILTIDSFKKDMGILSPVIKLSALTGNGIPELESAIYDSVIDNKVVAESTDIMINLRHKQCLIRAKENIVKAAGSVNSSIQPDLVSIDIRDAVSALGEVTGEAVSDEIIDRIFEEFCVGK